MDIVPVQDFEVLILLPQICAGFIRCPEPGCNAEHGFCIEIGWLFWTLNIYFPSK